MRRTIFLLLMVLVWFALLACCYRGIRVVAVPMPPQPTFHAPLTPTEGDTSFVVKSLGEQEARLAWEDAHGVHEVLMSRPDFDRMFGVVRVEPLTPEEQAKAR